MSILLSSTRIKGVQFDFYPDGVEVRYSLCIKNILASILSSEMADSGLYAQYLINDVGYSVYLVPSKKNWYLTKRMSYSYVSLPKNLLVLAKEYREELEKYRNELYVRFEDKIKQRLFEEFSKHREIPSNEKPYNYGCDEDYLY
jgi:hypothetical protein